MKLNEYLKTTVTLHLFFVILSGRGIDGVYLYYDYLIDGDTARIICDSNSGILPSVKSSSSLDKPHWVDIDKCNTSGCAVKENGTCQSKDCTDTHRLVCQVDSTCISGVKSRQNVSEINSTREEKSCEENCCHMKNCLGVSYENSTCLMYEAGTTEKYLFVKQNTVKTMKHEESKIPDTASLCLDPSSTGSLQPTGNLMSSIFNLKSSDSLSTIAFSSSDQGYISPTSTYTAGSSSMASSVDGTASVVSSIVQPSKVPPDLSSSLAPSFSSQCLCRCQGPTTILSEEESKSMMIKLRKELTIPKEDLSSTYRKKTSMPDYRVSATSIGLVGVGIMCVVFGSIIIMDLGMMPDSASQKGTSNQMNPDKNVCQGKTDQKTRDLINRGKSCPKPKKQPQTLLHLHLPPFVGPRYTGTLNAVESRHHYLSATNCCSIRNKENKPTRSTFQMSSSLPTNRTNTKMASKESASLTKSQDQGNAQRTTSKQMKGYVPQATTERIERRSRQRQNNLKLDVNDSPKKEHRNQFSFASSRNVKDKCVPLRQSKSTHSVNVQGRRAPVASAVSLPKSSYMYPTMKRMDSFDFPESSSRRSRLPIKRKHSISDCTPPENKHRSRGDKEEDVPRRFQSLSRIPIPQNASKPPNSSKPASLHKPKFESRMSLKPAGTKYSGTDSKTINWLKSDSLTVQEPSGVYMSTETFRDDGFLRDNNPSVGASKIPCLIDNMQLHSSSLVTEKTQSDDDISTPGQNKSPKLFTILQSETSTRQESSDVPKSSEMSANDDISRRNQYVTDEESKNLHLESNFDLVPSSLGMKSREPDNFYPTSPSESSECHASVVILPSSKLSSNVFTQLQSDAFTRQESPNVSDPSESATSDGDHGGSLRNVPFEHIMEREESKEKDFETLAPRLVADPVEIEDFVPIHEMIIPKSPTHPVVTEAVESTFLNDAEDSQRHESNQVEYIIPESEIKEFFQDCVTSEKLPEEIETKSLIQSPEESEKTFSNDEESKGHVTLLDTFQRLPSFDTDSNSMEADSSGVVVENSEYNENVLDQKEISKMDKVINEDSLAPTVTTGYSLDPAGADELLIRTSLEQFEAKEAAVIVDDSLDTTLEAVQILDQTDEESEVVASSVCEPTERMSAISIGESFEPNYEGKELNYTMSHSIEPLDTAIEDLEHNETLESDKVKSEMDQVILEDHLAPKVAGDYSLEPVDAEEPVMLVGASLDHISVDFVGKSFKPNYEGNDDMDTSNDSSYQSSISFSNESQENIDVDIKNLNQKQGFTRFAKIRRKLQAIFSANPGKTKHTAGSPLSKKKKDLAEEKNLEQPTQRMLSEENSVVELTDTDALINVPEQSVHYGNSACEQDDLIKYPIVENTNEPEIKSTEETENIDTVDNKEKMVERSTESDWEPSREITVVAEENGLVLTEDYSEEPKVEKDYSGDLKEQEECVEGSKNKEEAIVKGAGTPKEIGDKDESRVSRFLSKLFSKRDPKVDTEVDSSNNREDEEPSQIENVNVSENFILTDPDEIGNSSTDLPKNVSDLEPFTGEIVEGVFNVKTVDSLEEGATVMNLPQTMEGYQGQESGKNGEREEMTLGSSYVYPGSDQESNKLCLVSENKIEDAISIQSLQLSKTDSEGTMSDWKDCLPEISESPKLTMNDNLDRSPMGDSSTDFQRNVSDLEPIIEDENESENIPVHNEQMLNDKVQVVNSVYAKDNFKKCRIVEYAQNERETKSIRYFPEAGEDSLVPVFNEYNMRSEETGNTDTVGNEDKMSEELERTAENDLGLSMETFLEEDKECVEGSKNNEEPLITPKTIGNKDESRVSRFFSKLFGKRDPKVDTEVDSSNTRDDEMPSQTENGNVSENLILTDSDDVVGVVSNVQTVDFLEEDATVMNLPQAMEGCQGQESDKDGEREEMTLGSSYVYPGSDQGSNKLCLDSENEIEDPIPIQSLQLTKTESEGTMPAWKDCLPEISESPNLTMNNNLDRSPMGDSSTDFQRNVSDLEPIIEDANESENVPVHNEQMLNDKVQVVNSVDAEDNFKKCRIVEYAQNERETKSIEYFPEAGEDSLVPVFNEYNMRSEETGNTDTIGNEDKMSGELERTAENDLGLSMETFLEEDKECVEGSKNNEEPLITPKTIGNKDESRVSRFFSKLFDKCDPKVDTEVDSSNTREDEKPSHSENGHVSENFIYPDEIGNSSTDIPRNVSELEPFTEDANESENVPVELKTTTGGALMDESPEGSNELHGANQFSQNMSESEIKEFFQDCVTSEKVLEEAKTKENLFENQPTCTETTEMITSRYEGIKYQYPGDSSEDQRIKTEAKPPTKDVDLKSSKENLPGASGPQVILQEESNKDSKIEANETENKNPGKLKNPMFGFVPKLKRAFSFKGGKKDRSSNAAESAHITATDVVPTESAKEQPDNSPDEVEPPSETKILKEGVLQSGLTASNIVAPTILEAPAGVIDAIPIPSIHANLEYETLEPTKVETDELVMVRNVDSTSMETIFPETGTRKEELIEDQKEIIDGGEKPEKEDVSYFESFAKLEVEEVPELQAVSGPTIPSEGTLDKSSASDKTDDSKKSRGWYEKVKDFFGPKRSEEGSFDELTGADTFQRSESYHPKLLDSDVDSVSYGSSSHWSDIVDDKVVATLTGEMLETGSKSKKRKGGSEKDPSTAELNNISFGRDDSIDSFATYFPVDNYDEGSFHSNVQFEAEENSIHADQHPATEASFPDQGEDKHESDNTSTQATVSPCDPGLNITSTYPTEKLNSVEMLDQTPEVTVTTEMFHWTETEQGVNLSSFAPTVTREENCDGVHQDPTEMVPVSPETMIHGMDTSIKEPANVAEYQPIPEHIHIEQIPPVMEEIADEMVGQSYKKALHQVFAHLDHKTLCVTSRVCKEWRRVSYHPSLWQQVVFSHGRMTSEFLERFSHRCSQLKSLRLENIRGRPKKPGESERFYQQEMRASLESGLESVLIKAEGELQKLTIINCGPVITERCLWLVSSYASVLQHLTYRSSTYPPSAEVLWALATSCRDITHLNLSPDNPRSSQQQSFNNKCAHLIAKNYPRLKSISIGGAGIDDVGLIIIAEKCLRIERLELYNFVHGLIPSSVEIMCTNGLQRLQELHLIHMAVDTKIIPVFARLCPNLTKIKIQVEIQDYFGDIIQPKDKRKYKLICVRLMSLKSQWKLDRILELDFKDCK